MEENENVRFRDRSLDELIGFLPSDMPGNGQFNHVRLPQASSPPIQRLEPVYSNENVDPAFMTRPNVFFHDNYQYHQRESVPFLMHPPPIPTLPLATPPPPGMVDIQGGDFVILDGQNTQKIHNGHNINMNMNKTNETLTGVNNNYGMEYPISNYNLFSGFIRMRYPPPQVPQMPQAPENNAKAQLIENLVGNWASDQSGTYSPFGTPLSGLRTQIIDNINRDAEKINSAPKTRIVAEIQPMGPSYSDVLTKSIVKNGPKSNPKKPQVPQTVKQKNVSEPVKAKPGKFSVGRTLSGNRNILNRQSAPGEKVSNCLNESNQKRMCSESDGQGKDSLSKKWLSLDDLKDTGKRETYMSMNDVKNKKKNNNNNNEKVENNQKRPKKKCEMKYRDQRLLEIWFRKARPIEEWLEEATKPYPKKKRKRSQNTQNQKVQGKDSRETNAGTSTKQETFNNNNRTTEKKRVPWKIQIPKSSKRSSRNVGTSEKHEKTVRTSRRDQDACISTIIKVQMERSGGVLLFALNWLIWLVLDVLCLSTYLAIHLCTTLWTSSVTNVAQMYNKFCCSVRKMKLIQRIVNSRFYPFRKPLPEWNKYRRECGFGGDFGSKAKIQGGLKQNIPLPETGEEAIKRLLACKERDAYYILGVTGDCTDDDIKKYYKRQAFLVHPDKNNRIGAEEAFKILTKAFNLIRTPNKRMIYNKNFQTEEERLELFRAEIERQREYYATTMRCTNCKARHRRPTVSRPLYAARMCGQCKIHHAVKEGDVWAEKSMFGLLWNYYACMDGVVYDITEWVGCQGKKLRNIKANTHDVQYRVARRARPEWRHPLEGCGVEIDYDAYEYFKNFCAKQSSRTEGMDSDKMSGKK